MWSRNYLDKHCSKSLDKGEGGNDDYKHSLSLLKNYCFLISLLYHTYPTFSQGK
jgi:hypothetical protein